MGPGVHAWSDTWKKGVIIGINTQNNEDRCVCAYVFTRSYG